MEGVTVTDWCDAKRDILKRINCNCGGRRNGEHGVVEVEGTGEGIDRSKMAVSSVSFRSRAEPERGKKEKKKKSDNCHLHLRLHGRSLSRLCPRRY
jgi:hypothetical protein